MLHSDSENPSKELGAGQGTDQQAWQTEPQAVQKQELGLCGQSGQGCPSRVLKDKEEFAREESEPICVHSSVKQRHAEWLLVRG